MIPLNSLPGRFFKMEREPGGEPHFFAGQTKKLIWQALENKKPADS
jgi:hypothetical protein